MAELAPSLPWAPNVRVGVSIENRRFVDRADELRRVPASVRFISAEPLLGRLEGLDLSGIHWLIAGGESGPRARPMHPDWARDLRDRCQAAEVAFFFKQWGAHRPAIAGDRAPLVIDSRGRPSHPLDVAGGAAAAMCRVGKRNASRVLDGRTWDE